MSVLVEITRALSSLLGTIGAIALNPAGATAVQNLVVASHWLDVAAALVAVAAVGGPPGGAFSSRVRPGRPVERSSSPALLSPPG